jgi:hypothetical protein
MSFGQGQVAVRPLASGLRFRQARHRAYAWALHGFPPRPRVSLSIPAIGRTGAPIIRWALTHPVASVLMPSHQFNAPMVNDYLSHTPFLFFRLPDDLTT